MSMGENALSMSFPLLQVWLPGPRASSGRAELVALEKAVVKTARGLSKSDPSFPWELLLNRGCPAGPCPSYSPRHIPAVSVQGHCHADPGLDPQADVQTWPQSSHPTPDLPGHHGAMADPGHHHQA